MPILTNARHERFARGVAEGKSQTQAYTDAGYGSQGARGNAARLIANDSVAGRVAELQAMAADKAEITIDLLKDMLLQDRQLAYQTGQAGAASGATVSLGKLYGHFVDRSLNQNVNMEFVVGAEAVSREEWLRQHGNTEPETMQ